MGKGEGGRCGRRIENEGRGTNFGVVETVWCKGRAGCFAAVVAMAEFRIYGVAGDFVGDCSAEA